MPMTRILPFLFLLCLLPSLRLQAGEPDSRATAAASSDSIDKALFNVRYKMKSVNDTLKRKHHRETVVLQVGQHCSKFFSYTKFQTDSVLSIDKANNASLDVMLMHRRQYGTSYVSYQIYKRYPTGKTTTLDQFGTTVRVRVEEDSELPMWTLQSDTATVMTYACRKATCRFRGRNWIAWYTTQVPVSDGPWKLYGLPGLILEAYDEQDHYHFSATALIQCRDEVSITFDDKDRETVTPEEYRKLLERDNYDPLSFIMSSAGKEVKVYDESMNEVSFKNRPYNPIERE